MLKRVLIVVFRAVFSLALLSRPRACRGPLDMLVAAPISDPLWP